eukprot:2877206-Rhodomonas_salina.3
MRLSSLSSRARRVAPGTPIRHRQLHREIKAKKPHRRYKVYGGCGVASLISQRTWSASMAVLTRVNACVCSDSAFLSRSFVWQRDT